MVMMIVSHNSSISMNASNGDFTPKNSMVHIEFNISCNPKVIYAFFDCAVYRFLFHTMYSEIPIRTYNVIHTGPNIQLGGLKEGLFRVRYQVEMEETVNIDPIMPAT